MNNYKIQLKKQKLWEGCILASIAHAIMVAHYPEIANEHSWDGINYNVQNSEGARGTITFSDYYIAGAFRDDNSERLIGKNKIISYSGYFKDAQKEIKKMVEQETLQYLLNNINGTIAPLITTAFWGNDRDIFSSDPYEVFTDNGGFLIERQLMGIDMAIEEWKEYYDMTQQQCDLLRVIYKQKITQPNQILCLTSQEIDMIDSNDEEGLYESKISFGEIGIEWK
ncbi:MAG: hypothetical protein VB130_11610 [Clostridium sp.]|nr:hypothetical protein [Clostridium sp.]